MKILIWFLCITVFSVIRTSLEFAGVSFGAIPTILIMLATVFLPAPALCKLWDKHKSKKSDLSEERIEPSESPSRPSSNSHSPTTPKPIPVRPPSQTIEKQTVSIPARSSHPKNLSERIVTNTHTRSKTTYCKHCGKAIDNSTKKCTGCGKQYRKTKFAVVCTLSVISAVIFVFIAYMAINYSLAISAMYDQQFIKAQRYFDNLLVGEALFPDEYEYISAGVLMEEGKYVESLQSFSNITSIPVPSSVTDFLKNKIYTLGKELFDNRNYKLAYQHFDVLSSHKYKNSSDYRILCRCKTNPELSVYTYYDDLLQLIDYPAAKEILLTHENTFERFITSRWEEVGKNPYYFEKYSDSDGQFRCRYNLPEKPSSGSYYRFNNGVYFVGDISSGYEKCFEFTIIDEDTISVFCYKDGSTHKLIRQ